jgi:hypothetical protein
MRAVWKFGAEHVPGEWECFNTDFADSTITSHDALFQIAGLAGRNSSDCMEQLLTLSD